MFRKYTKWIPFGAYSYGCREHMVFAKRNLKTGMIKFKTKRVNTGLFTNDKEFIPIEMIDTQKAWDKLTNEEK